MYKVILFVMACAFMPFMAHADDEKSQPGMSIGTVWSRMRALSHIEILCDLGFGEPFTYP